MRRLPKNSLAQLLPLLAVDMLGEINEDRAIVILADATFGHLGSSLCHCVLGYLTFACDASDSVSHCCISTLTTVLVEANV